MPTFTHDPHRPPLDIFRLITLSLSFVLFLLLLLIPVNQGLTDQHATPTSKPQVTVAGRRRLAAPDAPPHGFVTRDMCYPQRFAPHGLILSDNVPLRLLDAFVSEDGHKTSSSSRLNVTFLFTALAATNVSRGPLAPARRFSAAEFDDIRFTCHFDRTKHHSNANDGQPPTKARFLSVQVVCPVPRPAEREVRQQGFFDVRLRTNRENTRGLTVRVCLNKPIPLAGMQRTQFVSRVPKHHYTAVAVSVRNVRHLLIEWIEYNRMMGIDFFYVYTNENDDAFTERMLQSYIQEGVVEVMPWPFCFYPGVFHDRWQWPAVQHALARHRQYVTWLAHYDVDEFPYPLNAKSKNIAMYLREWESSSRTIFGLRMGMVYFTTPKPEQTQIEAGTLAIDAFTHTDGRTTGPGRSKSFEYVPNTDFAYLHFPLEGRGDLVSIGDDLQLCHLKQLGKEPAKRFIKGPLRKDTKLQSLFPELRSRWKARRNRAPRNLEGFQIPTKNYMDLRNLTTNTEDPINQTTR